MVQLIDYASEAQIAKLFRGASTDFIANLLHEMSNLTGCTTGFYPTELEADSPMPEHFAAEVTQMGLDVSMAELQGHLLRHKGQPLEVFHKLCSFTQAFTAYSCFVGCPGSGQYARSGC